MHLKTLLAGLSLRSATADMETEITRISYDSRTTAPGDVFVAMTGFATPSVEKIVMKQDSCQLTVGYVPPTTVLSINYDSKGNLEETPSKYMLYELRKNGKAFYLYSVTTIMNDSVSGTEFNTGTVGRVDTLTPSDSQGSGNTQAP